MKQFIFVFQWETYRRKNKMEDKSATYVEFKRHLVDSRMQSLPGKPNNKFFSELLSLLDLFHMSSNVIKGNFEVTCEFQCSKEGFYPLPLNLLHISLCNDFYLYLVRYSWNLIILQHFYSEKVSSLRKTDPQKWMLPQISLHLYA